MYKYESRYRYKGASVYGEPYIKIINKICEDNKKGFSILIPNCLDGIDVLPFLMRGAKVDCFEETKELIDGGVINKFKSVGLKNRIKGINCADKCNIFLSNFYSSKINKKYDDDCYHGHGTNGDRNKINSIINKGIRCSHDSMYFTTDPIGIGGDIDFDKINNWPFLKADYIIVVSNPIRFNILESSNLYTYQKGFDAFCYDYEGDEVLSQGKYVLPELIVGCYNVKDRTFEKNNRYYELLSSEDDYLYFIKNIMRIMKVIFGVDRLANQYLNNTNEFENEFNKLSNNNFNYFIKLINDNYILSKKNNYNKLTEEEMDLLKSNQEEILNFVELLIFKSLENNPDIKNKISEELKLENFRELYIITNGIKKKIVID